MNKVFLGPPVHWLIILVLVALGWIGGQLRFHVTEFNSFLVLLIVGAVLALLAVLATSAGGRRVTREPIVDHEDDGPPGSG